MLATIALALRPYLFKALFVVAALLAVLAILARAKHAGRMAERVEMAAKSAKVEKAMAKAAASGPKSKREVTERLRGGTF